MEFASVAVVALMAAPASARTISRFLQQTSPDTSCSWAGSGKCYVNGQLLHEMGAFGEDLQSSEGSFWDCFDASNPYAGCEAPTQPGSDMQPTPFKFSSGSESDSTPSPFPGGLPDYATPTKCPYANGRTNPLTSGKLPTKFQHKNPTPDFEAFAPDDTPVENETICDLDQEATERAHGQVLIKQADGLCVSCPEAKCTVWIPDWSGHYRPHCTGVIPLSDMADFYLNFPLPGDEEEAGWGPDSNPHVHFQCEGCGGLIYNKWMPLSNNEYCDTSPADNMIMSAPNDSNDMNSVKVGEEPGMFYLIMQDNWQMMASKTDAAGNACWSTTNANPCPEWAAKADGKDCSKTEFEGPGTRPEPEGDPILVPKAGTDTGGSSVATVVKEMTGCALEGHDLPEAAQEFSTGDASVPAVDAESCAAKCAAVEGCEAAEFVTKGTHNCYFKTATAGVMPVAVEAGAVPRTLIYLSPCEDLDWADGTGAKRRLAQAVDECVTIPLLGVEAACTAKGSFVGTDDAAEVTQVFDAAMTVLGDIDGFKAQCPPIDILAGAADEQCMSPWEAYLKVIGCKSCLTDLDQAEATLEKCSAATTESECTSETGTEGPASTEGPATTEGPASTEEPAMTNLGFAAGPASTPRDFSLESGENGVSDETPEVTSSAARRTSAVSMVALVAVVLMVVGWR